jgi:RHS repeat-associated protein
MRYKQEKTTSVGSETTIYIDKLFEKVTKGSTIEYRHYIGDFAIVKDTVESGVTSTEIAYLHRDRLGSMTAEVGPDGSVLGAYSFDPFGRPRDGQLVERDKLTSLFTLRGFTDHEQMNEMELIHMNGRAFDYNLGRFLSVDPVIQFEGNSQSINPYSYIMNNPLAGTDPSGYEAEPVYYDEPIESVPYKRGGGNWQTVLVNPGRSGQSTDSGNGKEDDVAAQAGAGGEVSNIGGAGARVASDGSTLGNANDIDRLDQIPADPQAVYDRAKLEAENNPSVVKGKRTDFVNKIVARECLDPKCNSNNFAKPFDSAEKAKEFLAKNPTYTLVDGITIDHSHIQVFRTATTPVKYEVSDRVGIAKHMAGRMSRVLNLSGVENVIRVLAHEGVHVSHPSARHEDNIFPETERNAIENHRR